jgi:hypothetical protein
LSDKIGAEAEMIEDKTLRDPDTQSPPLEFAIKTCPCAMLPFYRSTAVNDPVVLYEGPLKLSGAGDSKCEAQGKISLIFSPNPRIRFVMHDTGAEGLRFMMRPGSNSQLSIPGEDCSLPVVVNGIGNDMTGLLNGPGKIGSDRLIRHLFCHLINFADVHGESIYFADGNWYRAARVTLQAAGWRIVMDEVPNHEALKEGLREAGGYAITHVCRIERSDGSDFDAKAAVEVVSALRYFLSFCLGRWVGIALTASFDQDGQLFREEWTLRTATSWRYVSSCFSSDHIEMLSPLFEGFLKRFAEPLWKDALTRSLWWYISSNTQSGGIDGGVILSQVALELLAWVVFVEKGHIISQKAFDDLPTADKLRLLLDKMGVTLDVPPWLKDLTAFETGKKVPYAPFKFVEIRNALVHPKNRSSVDKAPDAMVDAWELSLWYIELAILFICEYRGQYVNRNIAPFAGHIEPVPWAEVQTR